MESVWQHSFSALHDANGYFRKTAYVRIPCKAEKTGYYITAMTQCQYYGNIAYVVDVREEDEED